MGWIIRGLCVGVEEWGRKLIGTRKKRQMGTRLYLLKVRDRGGLNSLSIGHIGKFLSIHHRKMMVGNAGGEYKGHL